jgi:hypothetical protein
MQNYSTKELRERKALMEELERMSEAVNANLKEIIGDHSLASLSNDLMEMEQMSNAVTADMKEIHEDETNLDELER